MTFRKFDTGTWKDPWFESLSTKAKLAYIYLWTNSYCTQAGVCELSNRRIEFELGYSIDTIFSELDTRIWRDHTRNLYWVKNFFRHQCQNAKFAIAALNSLADTPDVLSMFIAQYQQVLENYGVDLTPFKADTVPIPHPDGTDTFRVRTETEAEAENIMSGKPDTSPSQKIPFKEIVTDFNQVMSTSFKPGTQETQRLIRARWNAGFRVDDFKTVHRHLRDEWGEDPKMCQYLRPPTVFGTKFESYLQAAKKKDQGSEEPQYITETEIYGPCHGSPN
jgi:uncharacterized phage protein (TIGR02220 family)